MIFSKNNIVIPIETNTDWKKVILNTISGNVNLLNEEYGDYLMAIKNGEARCAADPEKDGNLLQRGYIYRNEADEKEKERQVLTDFIQKEQESKYNSYTVVVSNDCNQGCAYCKYKEKLNGEVISESAIEKIMEFIMQSEQADGLKQKPLLSLYGGETLPDSEQGLAVLKKFLSYIDQIGHLRIFTYGFRLNRYKDLLMAQDASKISFSFRLLENPSSYEPDQIFPEHAEEAFDWLRLQGVLTSLVLKVTKDNVNFSSDYINSFISKGYVYSNNCYIYLKPTFKEHCTLFNPCAIDYELYYEIFKQYANYPQMEATNFSGQGFLIMLQNLIKTRGKFDPLTLYCMANWNLVIITPDGDSYACYHAVGDKSLSLGNILKEGDDALDMKKLDVWRNRTVDSIASCRECSAKYLCGGGCAYESMRKCGSLSGNDCPPIEKVIRWAFELLHEDIMDSARYTKIIEEYRSV